MIAPRRSMLNVTVDVFSALRLQAYGRCLYSKLARNASYADNQTTSNFSASFKFEMDCMCLQARLRQSHKAILCNKRWRHFCRIIQQVYESMLKHYDTVVAKRFKHGAAARVPFSLNQMGKNMSVTPTTSCHCWNLDYTVGIGALTVGTIGQVSQRRHGKENRRMVV